MIDDDELYNTTSVCSRQAMEVLTQYLEAVRGWMGQNKLILNLCKTKLNKNGE